MQKTNKIIHLVEVGPRDGLQNELRILSTEDKLTYIEMLVSAGIKNLEVTSFVRPEKIPQMSDAKELSLGLKKKEGVHYYALIPNEKGFEEGLKAGIQAMAFFTATSEEFNKRNINASIAESFERMAPLVKKAQAQRIHTRGYISTVFGCPYVGNISIEQVKKVVGEFAELGVDEISLGDTIGVATPQQVKKIIKELSSVVDKKKLAMHFHDTRGMALTNIYASLDEGIEIFDSSSAGLGGCPYAKSATGNVATEEVVYLLHSLGYTTGIDLEKLMLASRFVLQKLQKKTSSKYLKALHADL
ncbi:MAG: hydroxymethylglutaryl-CoA lyase [Bacteriovoracaceae bacterium]|nr:hydroxymethylglutaryl-CoA lyase [Bacteriovoracaceae bacterium]